MQKQVSLEKIKTTYKVLVFLANFSNISITSSRQMKFVSQFEEKWRKSQRNWMTNMHNVFILHTSPNMQFLF